MHLWKLQNENKRELKTQQYLQNKYIRWILKDEHIDAYSKKKNIDLSVWTVSLDTYTRNLTKLWYLCNGIWYLHPRVNVLWKCEKKANEKEYFTCTATKWVKSTSCN